MTLGTMRILVLLAACAALGCGSGGGQPQELPPVTYICPMPEHAYVLEERAGACPVCNMALVPVRIEQTFTCPNHSGVVSDRAGNCPVNRRELMPVIVNLYWTCPEKPDEHLTDPGTCASGTPRTVVRQDRAHGNHNPRHGGQVFMAADRWHHLEATHPHPGLLRVYIYDNFTKPILANGFTGRAVTLEDFDAQATQVRELDAAPLRPSPDGKTLDAHINVKTLPARMTVKVTFGPELPEERFDFTFETYSKESLPE